MDEVELPPIASSQNGPSNLSRSFAGRKRPPSEYDPTTSSDPAVFSSDERAPSADDYAVKRRKGKWKGTWWGDRLRGETPRERRQFKRNFDSGIWMGSEGTESSLDDEFLSEQRTLEASRGLSINVWQAAAEAVLSRGQPHPAHSTQLDIPAAQDEISRPGVDNSPHARARRLVQLFIEEGHEDVDLS